MVLQVQMIENELHIVLPPQAAQDLHLVDGSSVEVKPLPSSDKPNIRYMSTEEALEIHRSLEPEYAEAYRALAK